MGFQCAGLTLWDCTTDLTRFEETVLPARHALKFALLCFSTEKFPISHQETQSHIQIGTGRIVDSLNLHVQRKANSLLTITANIQVRACISTLHIFLEDFFFFFYGTTSAGKPIVKPDYRSQSFLEHQYTWS